MTLRDREGWETILGPRTASGEVVTPATAMAVPAALGAVRLLSESVASLPLALYRRDRQGGRERAQDHPLHRLLHTTPNTRQTAFQFKEMMVLGLLTDGNAYAIIEWQDNGQPAALWPIPPSRVSVDQDQDTGRLTYKVSTRQGQQELPPDQVLHVLGMSFDGVRGVSPITMARESLGQSLAELRHGATFFKNANRPSGVIQVPEAISQEAHQRLATSWNHQFQGTDNAHRTAILEQGAQFQPIALNNRDSQWLESRTFSVREVARIFRVPGHLLGDLEKASYASIEAQNLEFLTYSLRPWLARIEQAVNRHLLTPKEQKSLYAEFVTADLLRADTQSRFQAYEVALRSGWMNVNEVRQRENLPPVEAGETHLVQLNTAPLHQVARQERPAPGEPRRLNVDMEQRAVPEARPRESNKDRIEAAARAMMAAENEAILAMVDANTPPAQIEEKLLQWYNARPEHPGSANNARKYLLPVFAAALREANRYAATKAGTAPWSEDEVAGLAGTYVAKVAKQHCAIGRDTARRVVHHAEDPYTELSEHLVDAYEARPGKIAQVQSTALESDATLETYRQAGVTRIVWKTQPDECEFCQQLDGKTVGIGEPFVEKGQEVPGPGGQAAGLTARQPRVAPPLHLGCKCELEPVTDL